MKARYLIIGLAALVAWSCSRKSAPQLYEEGIEAEGQQNFQLAVQRFDEVIERFQQSPYAESSLSRSAVIYNNDLHDIRQAVLCYQKIYTLYPTGKQAPTALFLSAFLLNNDLHSIDSARLAYELFLQKYPEHELASSAKFELENLGKDPSLFMKSEITSAENAPQTGKVRKK
jgi:outer membrane protein assembly factor BamD (BamD/ComL family)